jgi:hypothetical protein
MGLLASIVAYLSVVAAIVVGFLMSADALLYHSYHRASNPRPEITMAARLDSSQMKTAAKPPRKTAPPRKPAEQQAIPRRSMATEYRRKIELSNTRAREPRKRTVHEVQRRYLPLYREHAAEPRALGYAEEPRFGGNPWR